MNPARHHGPHGMADVEAKAAFLLGLRARGLRSLAVLNALEAVPRDVFVPHRYADLATRDVALPIPCGQTMPEPFFVGRAVEALAPDASSRVLEIGAGSGYVTAILAKLALEVLSIERYASLASLARTRLEALGVANAAVVWGDGLAIPAAAGLFDRILVNAALPSLPEVLTDRLSDPGGRIVYARAGAPESGGQVLVEACRDAEGGWIETVIGPSRLRLLEPGMSKIL